MGSRILQSCYRLLLRNALIEISYAVRRCRVLSQDIQGVVQRSVDSVALKKSIELGLFEGVSKKIDVVFVMLEVIDHRQNRLELVSMHG